MTTATSTPDGRLLLHPRALVVVESMFGNTERLARAVAAGLDIEGVDATLVDVGDAPAEVPGDVDLAVLGAPTHAFSLSRPQTRADAVKHGARPDHARSGIREWVTTAVPEDPRHAAEVAAFDTRVARPRFLPHAASRRALELARRQGFVVRAKPAWFYVDAVEGPTSDGEVDEALLWGRSLGQATRTRVAEARQHTSSTRR